MIASIRQLSKTTAMQMPEINWEKFCISGIMIMLALLFLCLVFYVFYVNELTKGSYAIKNYEKEISSLSDKNSKLETAFAQAGFLRNIEQRAGELNFEKIKEIKYIQVLNSSLAKAQ